MVRLVLLILLFGYAEGHSNGAPDSMQICSSMMPGHGVKPQASVSPFKIKVNPSGENVSVTIEADADAVFKGFLIETRNLTGSTFGTWDLSTSNFTKIISCGVTHSKAVNRTSEQLVWMAPTDYKGTALIRATVVQTREVFWTNITAEPLLFDPDSKGAFVQANLTILAALTAIASLLL